MTTEELIEALDARYGNPYAAKECGLIQEAIERLRELEKQVIGDEYVFVCKRCGDELGIKFEEQEK